MSWPADVLLAWGRDEALMGQNDQPLIHDINHWLKQQAEEREYGKFHTLPEEFTNGYISAEHIYFGSFNFFAPDEVLGFLRGLAWQEPQNVQLIVRDLEAATFEIFTLADFREDETKQSREGIELLAAQGQFDGRLFAFDGTLTLLSRAQWSDIIERGGGHVTYSVSARTTCVIGGQNCDTELAKAYRMGIPTIWEHDLHARLKDRDEA